MSGNGQFIILREPKQLEIGSLEGHLCSVSPEIDGGSPVPGARKGQTVIIALPGGRPELTDAIRLAPVDQSPWHRGAPIPPPSDEWAKLLGLGLRVPTHPARLIFKHTGLSHEIKAAGLLLKEK